MPRYIKQTLILAKVETTSGTDAVPTGAADALLISDMSINPLEATNVDRANVRSFFGANEQLVATANVRVGFTVELAGSGTAGTAPQWGDLLLGCAFAEATLASPARIEYTPVSATLQSLTIYYYDAGVLHKLLGCMGNVKLMAKVGDRPKLQFDFVGVDGGISAASASGTYTAWRTPVTMTKANVPNDVTFGATYAAGALTAGTVFPSAGLDLDVGNQVNFTPLLSSESVDVTDRALVGTVMFDLTAAQEVSLMATVKANTLQTMGMKIGTAAGNSIVLHTPGVQLLNPSKQELNGRRMIGYDMRFPPIAGNDELRIVVL